MTATPKKIGSIAAVLLALAASLTVGGCGGGSDPVDKSDVKLTVLPSGGLEETPEKEILAQIYTQALRAAGYTVEKAPAAVLTETKFAALKAGKIDGYPEHLSTALHTDFGIGVEELPARAHAGYETALADLEKQELTAFPPTPFGIANAVGMLRKTAEERNLRTDSDLRGQAEEMTVKAPKYCHLSPECLGGIEQHYGTAFKAVSYEHSQSVELTWWRPEPNFLYEVLEDGESDASFLFTTDGRLAAKKSKFVILEDDKHAFPAGNVVWMTSPEVVDEAGPDYEKAIVSAQSGLTLKAIQELDAEVEAGKSPAKVAADYLKSLPQSD